MKPDGRSGHDRTINVSELSQAGVSSPAHVPGPYSNREDLLYAFVRFIVDIHERQGLKNIQA